MGRRVVTSRRLLASRTHKGDLCHAKHAAQIVHTYAEVLLIPENRINKCGKLLNKNADMLIREALHDIRFMIAAEKTRHCDHAAAAAAASSIVQGHQARATEKVVKDVKKKVAALEKAKVKVAQAQGAVNKLAPPKTRG